MGNYRQYEDDFENNPKGTIVKTMFWVLGIVILFSVIGYGLGWFSEAAVVAKEEFGAKASLKKYEWFKDASETIEAKRQTILVYEANLTDIDEQYGNVPRKDWDRLDKMQYNQWRAEITGIKASYNKVVKEYNAQSSKFNWRGYNTTDLPMTYDLYMDK